MIHSIRTACTRHDTQLLEDSLGAIALVVIFLGALHLPVLF